jgi:hypothetical protein
MLLASFRFVALKENTLGLKFFATLSLSKIAGKMLELLFEFWAFYIFTNREWNSQRKSDEL